MGPPMMRMPSQGQERKHGYISRAKLIGLTALDGCCGACSAWQQAGSMNWGSLAE